MGKYHGHDINKKQRSSIGITPVGWRIGYPLAERYGALIRTAIRLFKTPVAAITRFDDERHWFKSISGFDVFATEEDDAFCAQTILQDDVFVVLDTIEDPEFSDHPLVIGEPFIRFYAGAPLTAPDGMRLGTFYIGDFVPRSEFSDEDRETLKDLATTMLDLLIIENSLVIDVGAMSNQDNEDVPNQAPDVYTILIKQSPIPVIMLDNKMRILAESDRWRRLWNVHPQNKHYSLPLRTAYPSIPALWHRELEHCVQSGEKCTGYTQLEICPGYKNYFIWEISPWQLLDGTSGAFLCVSNQTEQRKAEEAAKISDLRFQSIVQKIPTMMHSIDAKGCLLEVSDCWLDKLGYRREDVLGRSLTDFLTPESQTLARDVELPKFFETGTSKDIPFHFVCANGDILDILLTAYGERGMDGNIVRSLAVLTDVQDGAAQVRRFNENLLKMSTDP